MSLVPLLFFTGVTIYLLFLVLLQVIFWYETLNAPCNEVKTRSFSLATAVRQYLNSFAVYAVRPFILPLWMLFRKKRSAHNTGKRTPFVVLVHGIYDNSSTWIYLESRLRRDGFRTAQFGYSSFSRSLSELVDDLHDFLQALPHDGVKPLLIGHSNGGILIRSWLLRKKNASMIGGAVTLSTPHEGSRLAVFGPGRLVENLKPGSALLNRLAEDDAPGIPCTALASGADEMVLPSNSLLPPQGWKFRFTGYQNHLGMLFSPGVYGMLKEELDFFQGAPGAAEDSGSDPVAAGA